MNKKLLTIFTGIGCLLCLIVPSFGALIYGENILPSISEPVGDGDDLCKVTFRGLNGSADVIEYYNKDYELSLKDAPFVYSGGTVYTWVSGSYQLQNHIVLSGDLTLSPQSVSAKTTLIAEYYEEYSTNYPEKQGSYVNTDVNTNSPKYSGGDDVHNAGLDNQITINTPWLDCSNNTRFHVKGDNGKSGDSTTTLDNTYSTEEFMVARRNTGASGYSGSRVATNHAGRQIGYYGQSYNSGDLWAGVTGWGFTGGSLVSYTRGNSSIGLETHDADYLRGEENDYNKFYKPINLSDFSASPFNGGVSVFGDSVGAEYQSEYCANRLKLNCDVVMTGGSLTMAGLTGFIYAVRDFKNNAGAPLQWTQVDYQGFMVGPYSEIDLNGFDLILENGSTIDCYGSITDSSAERTGTIILRNGTTLSTSLVFEDMWRENSIPEIYAGGTDFMQMYRCPYLDCNVIFEYGSKFYGYLFISFGKSMGAFNTKIGIIGPCPSGGPNVASTPDNHFIFQMESGSGYIKRTTYYNEELYNKVASSKTNPTLYNIAYQRFRYSFVDCIVHVCGFCANVKLDGKDVNVSSKKYQFWVPPYFDFYSYGSTFYLYQQYVFAVGSYIYADSKTTINFSYSNFQIGDFLDSWNYMEYADNQYNDCSGGILMCQDYYNVLDGNAGSGWFDTRKTNDGGNEGNGNKVYSWTDFWNYYSQKPAVFDCNASLTFEGGNKIPYVLCGQINFKSNSGFSSSIEGRDVNLYGAAAYTGPSTAAIGIGVDLHQVNLASIYTMPLVSNGEVVTSMPGESGTETYIYNIKTGIVTNVADPNNTYAYIFDNPTGSAENINYAYNSSSGGINSLSGTFQQVTFNSSQHLIQLPSSKYLAFYHGCFLPYSNQTINISKFCGFDSNTKNGRFRNVSYSSSKWTVTGINSGGFTW